MNTGQLTNQFDRDGSYLALKLLERTRALLDGGKRWRPNKLAAGRLGFSCDPLSERAYFFSLVGAAMRARWELREELAAAAESGEIRIVHILHALSSAPSTPSAGERGWIHVDSILLGLERVLVEFALDSPWEYSVQSA